MWDYAASTVYTYVCTYVYCWMAMYNYAHTIYKTDQPLRKYTTWESLTYSIYVIYRNVYFNVLTVKIHRLWDTGIVYWHSILA